VIRIGSRGSALARWQADYIAAELRRRGQQVSIEILVTTGDRVQNAPYMQVGAKGMFTKEIEEALEENRIDLAVHSLKDLPTELPAHFTLAAIPPRADARDAFVSIRHENFSALPQGSVVGTSSLRRQAQLRALRADLDVRELRGNVDTRLRKLAAGEADALVLALAGLDRLGRADAVSAIADEFVPAAGQGALALEGRVGELAADPRLDAARDPVSGVCVTAERTLVHALGASCHTPVGAHARRREDGLLELVGWVGLPDGSEWLRDEVTGDPDDVGARCAERMLAAGARELLDRAEQQVLL
jgi:hydroxymethylbilane synthase